MLALLTLLVHRYRFLDGLDGLLAPLNSINRDGRWFSFERFVRLEEMRVLLERVLVEVFEIFHIVPALVLYRYRDDFVIALAAVYHFHDRDRAHRDEDAGIEGVGRENDDVERVVVIPECLRCETVIKWVGRGGIIDAVELDESGRLVYLVFIGRAFRYLDDDINLIGGIIAERYVVP